MDGLGKDIEAAAAARTAVGVLRKYGAGSIVSLIKRCHRSLMMTRGAVMTLAAVDLRANLHWLGIGNVEAVLVRADAAAVPAVERLRLQGGVVGYQLPILAERKRTLQPGDILALATDGIQGDFVGELRREENPQRMAERILERHFKGNDDALILVARYSRAAHE
jgi:serine phosphatase RsbU (regulator of sigma subunit)